MRQECSGKRSRTPGSLEYTLNCDTDIPNEHKLREGQEGSDEFNR